MRARTLLLPLMAVVILAAAAVPARADVWFTPYLGSSLKTDFGGWNPGRAWHYGAALTWVGRAGLGVEIDLAYSPKFFEPGEEDFLDFDGDGNLTTLMGNLVWALPTPLVQPYVSAGLGLMRSHLEAPLDLFTYTDRGFGVNVGGGLRLGGRGAALRGDLRYFRQLDDVSPFRAIRLGTFTCWRGSVGLSLGF